MQNREKALKWWKKFTYEEKVHIIWEWRKNTSHQYKYWQTLMIMRADHMIESIYTELNPEQNELEKDLQHPMGNYCGVCYYLPIRLAYPFV